MDKYIVYKKLIPLLHAEYHAKFDLTSHKLLQDVYIDNKKLFEKVLKEFTKLKQPDLYAQMLKSLVFADIDMRNRYVEKIIKRCLVCDSKSIIERAIFTLEVINDKKFIKKFKRIKILKSKALKERFEKVLNNLS